MKSDSGLRIIDRLQPLTEALTRLSRNRTITLLVTLSLALGIGANTAIFTLVDAVFLAPLPVADPARLFAVFTLDPRNPGPLSVSFPNYKDLKKRTSSFTELAASTDTRVNLGMGDEVREVSGELVTPNYFTMAGVSPRLGAAFSEQPEGESAQAPSVILSHALWRKRFASDPNVLGRVVTINKMPFAVTGVMPPAFKGFERIGSTDLWLPMTAYRAVLERPDWITVRRGLMFYVIGRLKPGIGKQSAADDVDAVGKQLAAEFPMENAERSFSLMALDEASVGPERRSSLIRAALVLMSAAGVVLLIAIANIGNVLLSRASGRRREMAVRLALGATRRKLLLQVIIESGLLVLIGGAVGLLVGTGGRELLWRFRPEGLSPDDLILGLNWRVLAFSTFLSLLTGVVASLLPALQSLRGDITGELRERAANNKSAWRRLHWREALVVCQVALSLVALVGADLFLKSLRNAQAIDPGFDTRNVATFDINPSRLGLGPKKRLDFYRGVQDKLSAIPGVQSVSIASNPLLGEGTLRRTIHVDGSAKDGVIIRVNMISERYFETTDVLVLRGRDFTTEDKYDAPLVAIVNETMARRFWPNESSLGKRFRLFGDEADHTVVGVARDSVYNAIGETPEPCVFLPMLQTMSPTATVLVRTANDPSLLIKALETALRQFHPGLPAVEVVPVHQAINQALWAPRMAAAMLAVFGLLALALASVGVYGVTGHMVSQRTGELGVRMALGACPMDVMELILRQCLTLILPGLAIGAVASFALAHFCFQNLLFGVNETDLEPYLVASLLLAVVALVASYLPARRAVGMHPVMALREQ